MKKIICIILLAIPLSAEAPLPMKALERLTATDFEQCNLCIKDMQEKSFKELNKFFKPGRAFKVTGSDFFMRTGACSKDEFLRRSYARRKFYKRDMRGRDVFYPLVTYRVHTEKKHLDGMEKKFFTDQKIKEELFGAMKKRKKVKGTLVIAPYPYGEGKAFIYFPKQNKIQVQCKVLSVDSL